MRSKFDEQLSTLNQELISMGAMCEQAIALASKALSTADISLAKNVFPLDMEIDEMERTIENLCLKLLLQQQPVAKDLRQVSAALKMITDMERIGDQAADIAEIVISLNGKKPKECEIITSMAHASIKIVTESIDAYVKKDVSLANVAIEHDDVVDEYFLKAKRKLIEMIANNPENGEYAIDLLMVAKYFERIADHATNIAEWVVFSVTGQHKSQEL